MIFKTIEEKLADEIKYGITKPTSDKKHKELMQEQRDVYLTPPEKMTFVIAHCIYNEVEYFQECLEDDLKMNDVDIIHIVDGAWKGYEGGTAQSNDGTLEIIHNFKKKAEAVGILVIYDSRGVWSHESVKRNYQLKAIDKIVKTPYYILVKDGDEFFHFLNGRQSLWLKRDMVEWQKTQNDAGIISAYSYNSDIEMMGMRLFPSTNKLHYYTEKPMILHDENHKLVMDYNVPTFKMNMDRVFKFASFILINRWNIRNKDRIQEKYGYLDDQDPNIKNECRFI